MIIKMNNHNKQIDKMTIKILLEKLKYETNKIKK